MLDWDALTDEQIERALRRYHIHEKTDDQIVRWLASLRPRARVRYALRHAEMDDRIRETNGTEMDRSLAYAVIRAERDADLAAQRVELARRKGVDVFRKERATADALMDRHARLLGLWFGAGGGAARRAAENPAHRERRAGSRSGRALIESMLSDEAGQVIEGSGEAPPGGEPDGGTDDLIG